MLGTSAFAQMSISENADTKVFTASGTMAGTEKTNLISLNVYNANNEKVYTGAIPTKDGSVSGFNFKIPDVTGEYTMKFTSFGASEEYKYSYVSTTDVATIIGTINGVTVDPESYADEDAVVAVMDANVATFGFDAYWYGKLDLYAKREIAASILNGMGSGYTSLETIKTNASDSYIKAAFATRTVEDAVRFIGDFGTVVDWENNVTFYKEYAAITDTDTKTLLGKIFEKETAETKAEMYAALDRSMLILQIDRAKDPETIKDLIENNKTIITFDMTTYNKTDIDKTCAYLYGKNLQTMDDLEDCIEDAWKSQKKANSSSGGGSSWRPTTSNDEKSDIIYTDPTATPSQSSGFADLGSVEWAKDAIDDLVTRGVVDGISSTEFNPLGDVTREQFAKMLVKAFNLAGTSNITYTDVPEDHWAYETVSAASANGVVNGIGNGLFGTGANITRQDMAVMAVKAAEKAGYSVSGSVLAEFEDMESVADYAKDSIVKMVQAGVMSGFEDGTVRPQSFATRAQAAKIIYSLLQLGK